MAPFFPLVEQLPRLIEMLLPWAKSIAIFYSVTGIVWLAIARGKGGKDYRFFRT